MQKILIVIMSLYGGGAEKSLVNFLNELPENKFDVDLLLFKETGMFLSQVPTWVNIIDTPERLRKLYSPVKKSGDMIFTKIIGTFFARIMTSNHNMRQGYRWERFYTKKVAQLDKEYDVAIAYTTGEAMFYVADKVKANRKITWIHNDYKSAKHPSDYKYFKDFELVTISNECAKLFMEEFADSNKKVHNIANITSSKMTRSRADEFYPKEFNKEDKKILSIGRLCEQKGFDIAILAAAILKTYKIDFKWFIIGDGTWRAKLQAMISDNNLDDNVFLLGTRENPYPYIKNCDILAQTSRYEGKSVVLDEAKILGAPILVTNYPTVSDQIEGMEGLIVDLTPEAIAEGLKKLITDDSFRKEYSNYLLSREYGNQEEIKKYIALIEGQL